MFPPNDNSLFHDPANPRWPEVGAHSSSEPHRTSLLSHSVSTRRATIKVRAHDASPTAKRHQSARPRCVENSDARSKRCTRREKESPSSLAPTSARIRWRVPREPTRAGDSATSPGDLPGSPRPPSTSPPPLAACLTAATSDRRAARRVVRVHRVVRVFQLVGVVHSWRRISDIFSDERYVLLTLDKEGRISAINKLTDAEFTALPPTEVRVVLVCSRRQCCRARRAIAPPLLHTTTNRGVSHCRASSVRAAADRMDSRRSGAAVDRARAAADRRTTPPAARRPRTARPAASRVSSAGARSTTSRSVRAPSRCVLLLHAAVPPFFFFVLFPELSPSLSSGAAACSFFCCCCFEYPSDRDASSRDTASLHRTRGNARKCCARHTRLTAVFSCCNITSHQVLRAAYASDHEAFAKLCKDERVRDFFLGKKARVHVCGSIARPNARVKHARAWGRSRRTGGAHGGR